MGFRLSGFEEFEKNIEKLQKNIEKLGGKHSIPFSELFPPFFMSKYTDYSSIEEFLEKSNFNVKSQEDFEKIPEHTMNSFVAVHTRFTIWNEMLTKAFEEWSVRQLGI